MSDRRLLSALADVAVTEARRKPKPARLNHSKKPKPEKENTTMSEIMGTPLQELSGEGGLTHHQTTPLHRHGITTVEQLAALVDAHRANPDGSELSTVASFGHTRIERTCSAIDRWRGTAVDQH